MNHSIPNSIFCSLLSACLAVYSCSLFAASNPIPKAVLETATKSAATENLSLTIEQATVVGLESNLDLIANRYSIPQAEADELTASLWPNPSLLLDAGLQPFGANWNQTNAGGPKQNDIVLSYPLDLSGKRRLGRDSAHEAVKIAKAQFEDAVRLKVLDIRLAYIDVLAQTAQLSLNREQEESLGRLVRAMEQKIGSSGRLPLLQTRAQLAFSQAQLDTKQRESTLRAARFQLAIQLARSDGEDKILATSGLRDFKFTSLPDKTKLTELALSTRPDVESLKLALQKSDVDHRLARAQAWDDITLTAGLTRQGPADANPSDPSSSGQAAALSWSAGISIPLPFFNRNQGNLKKSELVSEQTSKQIASKELSVTQELEGLVDQLKLGQNLIETYESTQLRRARIVRDNQQKLFGTGAGALLDYFDSVSAYHTTLSSYYDAVADYRRNSSRLAASIGKDNFK